MGLDGSAARHELQRLVDPDQARQALRAARPGDEAELHLREAGGRRIVEHPCVAREGDLETASERGPVDRRHDRLGAVLDGVEDVRQMRLARRLCHLADVGSGDEGSPRAGDDRCRDP